MDSMNNPYSAPKSSVRGVSNDAGVTPIMGEILGSASIWARFISVVNWIHFVLMILFIIMMLAAFFIALLSPQASGSKGFISTLFVLIIYGLPAMMYWYYARSMGRYASAAKQLRENIDQEEVATCFSASSTFMKVTIFFSILMLLFAVLGIIAAFALPAYQEYIQRASGF